MENKNLTFEEYIASDEERVEQKKVISNFGIAATLIGAVLSALAGTSLVPTGMVSMLVGSVGLVVLIIGITKLLSRKTVFVDKQSQEELKNSDIFFDTTELGNISRLYEQRDFGSIANLKRGNQSGIVLHVCGSENGNLYYTQLMKYVPYQYVPVFDAVKHTDANEVSALATLVRLYSEKA